jgi:hypothetical protein
MQQKPFAWEFDSRIISIQIAPRGENYVHLKVVGWSICWLACKIQNGCGFAVNRMRWLYRIRNVVNGISAGSVYTIEMEISRGSAYLEDFQRAV